MTESKEKIIQKLQNDFANLENEYNNNNPKMDTIEKTEYVNKLIEKQKYLIKENKNLKTGFEKMTKNINEANSLYFKKKEDYDKILQEKDRKLKEYKKKIVLLKIKINELHQEINLLKEYKGVKIKYINKNKYYSSKTYNYNNKNLKNKEHKRLLTYTPKIRNNPVAFDINLEMKTEENDNDIFGDINNI